MGHGQVNDLESQETSFCLLTVNPTAGQFAMRCELQSSSYPTEHCHGGYGTKQKTTKYSIMDTAV